MAKRLHFARVMVLRVAAGVVSLALYYVLMWMIASAVAAGYPESTNSRLILIAEGGAIGAALPLAYFVFQHVKRAPR